MVSAAGHPLDPAAELARANLAQEAFDIFCDWLYGWKRTSHRLSTEDRQAIKDWTPVPPALNRAFAAEDTAAVILHHLTRPEHAGRAWIERERDRLLASKPLPPKTFYKTFPTLAAAPGAADGPVVVGPYTVLEQLSRGDTAGMGLVYKAELPAGGKGNPHLALKVVRPTKRNDMPEAFARFRYECEVQARLADDNVVRTVNYSDGAFPYLAMELVYGPTLQDLLDHHARRPVPVELAVELTRHVAKGLRALRGRHTVHGDLKPANVLLQPVRTSDGCPTLWQAKVCDFGLAHAIDLEPPAVSHATAAARPGTLWYMSPEQVNRYSGRQADFSSDIFVLGIVAYQLLTGVHPYRRKADGQWDTAFPPPASPSATNPLVPPALDEVVLNMLSFVAEPRRTAGQVVAALDALQSREVVADWCRTRTASAAPIVGPGSWSAVQTRPVESTDIRPAAGRASGSTEVGAGLPNNGSAAEQTPPAPSVTRDQDEAVVRRVIDDIRGRLAALPPATLAAVRACAGPVVLVGRGEPPDLAGCLVADLADALVRRCQPDRLLVQFNRLLAREPAHRGSSAALLAEVPNRLLPLNYDPELQARFRAAVAAGRQLVEGLAGTKALAEVLAAGRQGGPALYRPAPDADALAGLLALPWEPPPLPEGTPADGDATAVTLCAVDVVDHLLREVGAGPPDRWGAVPAGPPRPWAGGDEGAADAARRLTERAASLGHKLAAANQLYDRDVYCVLGLPADPQDPFRRLVCEAIRRINAVLPALLFIEIVRRPDGPHVTLTTHLHYALVYARD